MAQVTLKGNAIKTVGELPKKGTMAPDFVLVKNDLSELSLKTLGRQRKVLNIFPSIDTGTCATSVRKFNEEAARLQDVVVVNISMDLPFALGRFCAAEGIKNVETASAFRSTFARDYGLLFADGPLAGLCSRCVIVLGVENQVLYTEQVAETVNEPNYAAALSALKS